MEAATAGGAPAGVVPGAGGSEGAPGAEQGQEAGSEAEVTEPGADLAAFRQSVDTRLDGALDAIRQMAQVVDQRIPAPQPEAQPSFEEQFNSLIENSPGGVIDPSQLSTLMEQSNKQAIEQALAPFQQQMQQFQQQMTAQELQGLQTAFPELADQKSADALADNVVNEVVGLRVPEQIAEGLMQNASFVRLVHLAKKAEAAAQGETPAGQGQQAVPQIETGGGAAPASGGGDEWDQIAGTGTPAGRIW